MTDQPSDDDVRRMALYLCGKGGHCNCPNREGKMCCWAKNTARAAIALGAKLPDLRMERGRLAQNVWEEAMFKKCFPTAEAWARAAEAARSAP